MKLPNEVLIAGNYAENQFPDVMNICEAIVRDCAKVCFDRGKPIHHTLVEIEARMCGHDLLARYGLEPK